MNSLRGAAQRADPAWPGPRSAAFADRSTRAHTSPAGLDLATAQAGGRWWTPAGLADRDPGINVPEPDVHDAMAGGALGSAGEVIAPATQRPALGMGMDRPVAAAGAARSGAARAAGLAPRVALDPVGDVPGLSAARALFPGVGVGGVAAGADGTANLANRGSAHLVTPHARRQVLPGITALAGSPVAEPVGQRLNLAAAHATRQADLRVIERQHPQQPQPIRGTI